MHTVGNDSTLKRKKFLTHVIVGMNPEDSMISEISQPQKDKFCMITFIWGVRVSQIYWDRK